MRDMILFLDDSPERAALAYQRMNEKDRSCTIWCTTAEEAITTLWDYRKLLKLVMLDHDLGGLHDISSSRPDTGMETIRWLEKLEKNDKKEFENFNEVYFIIHSWNTAGRIMLERLNKLGLKGEYKPFGLT